MNGVDGDTSPNEIGDFSMRGLLSDEQTGRNSIGGEYVVIVSGNVMPAKKGKKHTNIFICQLLCIEIGITVGIR